MPAPVKMKPPHYPIVYVRGYAGSQAEVEDTVATPYMGFNVGSTKIRQIWSGDIERYIFESPLVRLMKDHGYSDIFEGGSELAPHKRPPAKSVWIYRYYEPVSEDLGTGERPEMEDYAKGLHDLIEAMRDQYCGREGDGSAASVRAARDAFKVNLVAHSMGGLVVRCYLQNIARDRRMTPPVDKVYTYATPHGGIDFRLIGNIPSFLQFNNVDNFNEGKMREYLKLGRGDAANSLDGAFDPDRFFCLVGTNHRDYTAASGLSRVAVGPMSDGLVQIKNAYVQDAPRAFVHRSHSGHYGIVNSEEGYQMLRRFLFGDIRVDALMEIDEITVPQKVADAERRGKKVDYSYHVEVIARVRGARWDLHRRTVGEESAKFVTAERLKKAKTKPLHLASAYLMKGAKVNKRRRTMGFSVEVGVLVPEYVVDGFLFLDDHYEGGYLFRDKLNLEVDLEKKPPRLRYGWDKETPNLATSDWIEPEVNDGYGFRIPFEQDTRPGVHGTLILAARAWA